MIEINETISEIWVDEVQPVWEGGGSAGMGVEQFKYMGWPLDQTYDDGSEIRWTSRGHRKSG